MATWHCSNLACRLHHVLLNWRVLYPPSQSWPEVNRGLPEGNSYFVFSNRPIRARINNEWTLLCSLSQWPLSPLHSIHLAIMNLADTYLTSHFGLLGLESTLRSFKKKKKKKHLPKKIMFSVWAHGYFVYLFFFFGIPINLPALKCWDKYSETTGLWFHVGGRVFSKQLQFSFL